MKKINLFFMLLIGILAMQILFKMPTGFAFDNSIILWGIKSNTNETKPDAPANGAKLLQDYGGSYVADTQEKKVYFTFDLGYEAGYTAQVLDILKAHNIKGIFFLCGNFLKEKHLIQRMINEGHAIGNHTDRHKDLPALSEEGIKKDIRDFTCKFNEKYQGTDIKFFRPPQGRFSQKVLEITKAENLKTMLWSIAIVDWGKKPINAKENSEKITKRLHPGAIILFHITNSGTPEMLKLLLPMAEQKGYSIGAWTEL